MIDAQPRLSSLKAMIALAAVAFTVGLIAGLLCLPVA